MDIPSPGAEHPFSNEELRLAELLHQLLSLSDDQDSAGRITLRGPHGQFIGETTLSARDIETVTAALESVNAYRSMTEDDVLEAAALPLPEVDAADVNDMVKALENIANGGAA